MTIILNILNTSTQSNLELRIDASLRGECPTEAEILTEPETTHSLSDLDDLEV